MKTKLMAIGVIAVLASPAAAQQMSCFGILADPTVQALATRAMHQIPENSLTNPEEVYASFKRLLDEVALENVRNGPDHARSRRDLYIAVHAALLNNSAFTTRWNPPPSRIRPPGPPAPEGYRPPEPFHRMDPALHSLLIKTCFPKLETIEVRVAQTLKAESIAAEAARREEARRAEEQERRKSEEHNRLQEEHKRKIEAQKREAARQHEAWKLRQEEERIEAAKPINRLRSAYLNYRYVNSCHEARQGYLVVWINDVQMERARQAVSRLEKEILKEDATLNTAAVWDETARLQPSRIYEHQCKPSYEYLISTAPGLPTIKDFGQR